MINIAEHLERFYPYFDGEIEQSVAAAAAAQDNLSFRELATQYGVDNGPQSVRPYGDRRVMEYYQLVPKADYDETAARVCYASMATPADKSMAMRAIRLFAADPSAPLLVVGNPGAVGRRANRLRPIDAARVWRGQLGPAVSLSLQHLQNTGVKRAEFIGYSYGAELAASACAESCDFGIDARSGVWMEPVSMIDRGLISLASDFIDSGAALPEYVAASDSVALDEARASADTGLSRYVFGVLRLSNVAIAHALSRDGFSGRARLALDTQARFRATTVWGDASELSQPNRLKALGNELSATYGRRYGALIMKGMKHAGGDDINLHAAMVLQASRRNATA